MAIWSPAQRSRSKETSGRPRNSVNAIFPSFSDSVLEKYNQDSYVDVGSVSVKIGYWAHTLASFGEVDVTIQGSVPHDTSARLNAGWNLVGPIHEISVNALGENVRYVWGWNGETQSYFSVEGEEMLKPGMGYWVLINEDGNVNLGK